MSALYLGLWLAYTILAVYRNLRGIKRISLPAHVLQLGLLILAGGWAWQNSIFSRYLWSPLDVGLGLLLGHVLFACSLLITHRHAGDVAGHLSGLRGLGRFALQSPDMLFRFFGVCFVEELVYRVGAQSMLARTLGSSAVAILITAIAFCLLHQHFFRSGWWSALEFLLFSVVIGAMYAFTGSLALVVLVHLVRNFESVYLDYCALLEDGTDAATAARIVEERHARPALETV